MPWEARRDLTYLCSLSGACFTGDEDYLLVVDGFHDLILQGGDGKSLSETDQVGGSSVGRYLRYASVKPPSCGLVQLFINS